MAIDIIIAILIIVAVVTGAIRGLVRQLGTLVAFIVAILACRFFAPGLAQTWVSAQSEYATLLRACVYVLVFIVAFLSVNLIAKLLHATVSALSLSPLDRVAGAISARTVDSDCKRMPQRLFPARAAEPFRLSRQFPPVESMDIESRSRDRGLYREPINRAERY